MQQYHYPDFDDILTIKFLDKFEKNDPYWKESERVIINRIFYYVNNKPGFCFSNYLDAGCGRGRLLWVFRKHFKSITAIEPDVNRFSDSMKMSAEYGIKEKSELINISAEEFRSEERFDLIFCSHVIQHIHTGTVFPLMENLRNHLSDNGVIALTTCHSTDDNDRYGSNYMDNGTPVMDSISREEFDTLVNGRSKLPVHYFNADRLISDLAAIGLKTVDFRVFHVSREDRDMLQKPDIDDYVNSAPALQKQHGVDMFLLLEKA